MNLPEKISIRVIGLGNGDFLFIVLDLVCHNAVDS
jgi:hypothetical protein